MAQAGILLEDDRIELIEGEIIEMSPIGPLHAAIVARASAHFFRTFGNVAQVNVQNPIRLSDDTEPQPDLTLLRLRPDFYASHTLGPQDIFLVVEIADTSMTYDRCLKMPLYACSGIVEAWLIDVSRGTITIYRDASPDGYASSRVVRRGERLAPAAFPDCLLAVEDILG
jgi:Uma2 family endonuclease